MMTIILVAVACVLSAILYRAGGQGKDPGSKPKWMPMWLRFDQARDALCPLVMIGLVMLLFGVSKNWWCYLIAFGASWGMLTTYWDWLFGYDNFYMHGFGCSLATIPLFWCGVPLWVLLAHMAVCTVGMGVWSALVGTDYVEEEGRGVFYII